MRGIGYISDMIFDRELDYYALLGRETEPALTSNSLIMQLRWCLRGAGICMLPDFVAREHPELRLLLPDDVRLTRAFYLVRHQDDARVARINRMAEVVVDWMRAALTSRATVPDTCHASREIRQRFTAIRDVWNVYGMRMESVLRVKDGRIESLPRARVRHPSPEPPARCGRAGSSGSQGRRCETQTSAAGGRAAGSSRLASVTSMLSGAAW